MHTRRAVKTEQYNNIDSFFSSFVCYTQKQEAQLSQRDRATLRVIEYFAKSLEVIRSNTAA